ncbi:unnamed protein product [Effrenium voratum]|nr:unnamed protein product [Effrenium voratum]
MGASRRTTLAACCSRRGGHCLAAGHAQLAQVSWAQGSGAQRHVAVCLSGRCAFERRHRSCGRGHRCGGSARCLRHAPRGASLWLLARGRGLRAVLRPRLRHLRQLSVLAGAAGGGQDRGLRAVLRPQPLEISPGGGPLPQLRAGASKKCWSAALRCLHFAVLGGRRRGLLGGPFRALRLQCAGARVGVHASHCHGAGGQPLQPGGLIRAVQFHSLRGLVYLQAVEVFPRTAAEVEVDFRLSVAAENVQGLHFRWRFDDTAEGCSWQQWPTVSCCSSNTSVPDAKLWTPQQPHLHRLKVALLLGEELLDCQEVRFGLRTLEAKGREIRLNGQKLSLFGLNRHDLWSSAVLTQEQLVQDVQLLKNLGANFVRGAHYAQDQRFLDLCDEQGLLVWEEVLGWQNTPQDFADGIFMMQSLKLADEMVAASVNHPSVIFFGFFNEGRSDDPSPATEAAYRSMSQRLRERSKSSRLISWGSNAAANDRYLHYADVCSFHAYPAWYPSDAPGNLEEVKGIPLIWEAYGRYVAELFPEKPLLITEAGAGGLYGHHGPSEEKWSEEYQSLLMQMHYLSIFTNPSIAGLALWQFADVPIDRQTSSEEHRPRGLNNKGVLSLSRQPKLAFQALRLLRNRKEGEYFGLILPPEDSERLTGLFKEDPEDHSEESPDMYVPVLPSMGSPASPVSPVQLGRIQVLEMEIRRLKALEKASLPASLPAQLPSLDASPKEPRPREPREVKEKVSPEHLELMKAHRELLQVLQTQATSHEELTRQHTELLKAHQALLASAVSPAPAPAAREAPAPLTPAPPPSNAPKGRHMRKAKSHYYVTNEVKLQLPSNPTLLDNTLLFLPERAVRDYNLEPNLDDKGDSEKYMWFGRVWELRALVDQMYQEKADAIRQRAEDLPESRKRELKLKMRDPAVRGKLKKLCARWKGSAFRRRCSFAVLDRLKYSHLRGTLIYAHGSGGCSWDNFRICRMIAGMGILVIAPDGFAYPKESAMGQMRHKALAPLHLGSDDVDYWANDLLYTSSAGGVFNYSTKAESVLKETQEYKDLYEKCYQLRRSELHFTIARLPAWVLSQGFFLGGTSEGAMTVARFDDQRYGEMIIGRFINSFSIEYCYFTPTPEAGLLGGQLDVPTLNIIGNKDQYFGAEDSIAKVVAEHGSGYGDKNLTGNGFNTMVRQGLENGLVCVLEDGVHSPCNTHDNFLRQLFNTFFSRAGSIWELHMIWEADPLLKSLVQLVEATDHRGKVTHLFVPKMVYPQRMTLREIETLRALHATDELDAAMKKEQTIIEAERGEIKEQLARCRTEAEKSPRAKASETKNFYAGDKLDSRKKWEDWVRLHSSQTRANSAQ